MHYVYSTLANDQHYVNYETPKGSDVAVRMGLDGKTHGDGVFIKGGANVANKREDTPAGHVTEVSDEALSYLNENHVFQQHVKNGFILIAEAKTDPEVAAADMTSRDESAPIVAEDLAPAEPQPDARTEALADGAGGGKASRKA